MDHRVRQMVWPLLQADFKLLETYQVLLCQTIPDIQCVSLPSTYIHDSNLKAQAAPLTSYLGL